MQYLRLVPLAALLSVAAVAHGQGLDDKATVFGKYRSDNMIRAQAQMSRFANPSRAYDHAVMTIAKMTEAKGFHRFAVIKVSDCGTMTINGSSIYVTCRVVARMLGADEVAQPVQGKPVNYYRTEAVLAGNLRPEGK